MDIIPRSATGTTSDQKTDILHQLARPLGWGLQDICFILFEQAAGRIMLHYQLMLARLKPKKKLPPPPDHHRWGEDRVKCGIIIPYIYTIINIHHFQQIQHVSGVCRPPGWTIPPSFPVFLHPTQCALTGHTSCLHSSNLICCRVSCAHFPQFMHSAVTYIHHAFIFHSLLPFCRSRCAVPCIMILFRIALGDRFWLRKMLDSPPYTHHLCLYLISALAYIWLRLRSCWCRITAFFRWDPSATPVRNELQGNTEYPVINLRCSKSLDA